MSIRGRQLLLSLSSAPEPDTYEQGLGGGTMNPDQPSPSNVTWKVKNEDERHKFKVSIFENGKVHNFIVERYTSTLSLGANTAYETIRIARDPPYYAIDSPLIIKILCSFEGDMSWESTISWRRDLSDSIPIEINMSQDLPYPYEISFSMEKTSSSSSRQPPNC